VSVNFAAKRMGYLPGTCALLAFAALALLSACQRAAEAPEPEVRPVRVMTIMSMKDIFLNLTRSNNAADCNIATRVQDAA